MVIQMKVLFIGNSYTAFHEMPQIFSDLCRDNGKDVTVEHVLKGGRKLWENLDVEDDWSEKLRALCAVGGYDVAILQEQSVIPATDRQEFFDGAKRIADYIAKTSPTVRFVLYQTWGRKAGHAMLEKIGMTSEEMSEKLIAGYAECAKLIGADISPVGELFFKAYHSKKVCVNIYYPDKTHPSYAGSCIAALSHYRTVFGSLPENMNAIGLPKQDLADILEVAFEN